MSQRRTGKPIQPGGSLNGVSAATALFVTEIFAEGATDENEANDARLDLDVVSRPQPPHPGATSETTTKATTKHSVSLLTNTKKMHQKEQQPTTTEPQQTTAATAQAASVQPRTMVNEYWMEPDWEPLDDNGQLIAPGVIRAEIDRYISESGYKPKAVINTMKVHPKSFNKFMRTDRIDRYKNDPWLATELSAYWAAARLLEAAKNKVDCSFVNRTELNKGSGPEVSKLRASRDKAGNSGTASHVNKRNTPQLTTTKQPSSMVAQARKISESGLLLPFPQHEPDRSEEQPRQNKRQKMDCAEDDPAAMVVTASVGALNTPTKAEVELMPAAIDSANVCTTTKSTSEEAFKNPESKEQSTENNSSKDVEQSQELKAALGAELPLDKDPDPASTHRCLLILQRLFKLSFSERIQSSGIRTVVKKFRNHPSIGELADRILIYWFLDRETRQWRQALDKSDLSKVEVKAAFFYLQVEKHGGLSVELMDRLSLRSLVEDSAALFESRGHQDGGFLERLERLTDLQH